MVWGVLAGLVCLGADAGAATLQVPGDHPSIPEAISAASSGDRIEVAAGTWSYEDGVLISAKDLELVGAGAATTSLQSEGEPALVIRSSTVTVSGFTVWSEEARGVEVRSESTATLVDLVIEGCTGDGEDGDGGGVLVRSESTVELHGCVLRDNQADAGGHLLVEAGSSVVVVDTLLEDGRADSGGGIRVRGGTLEVVDCTLFDNTASSSGGAISAENATVQLSDVVLEDNLAGTLGGAVHADRGDELVLDSVEVVYNTATSGGGLFLIGVERVEVTGSLLCGNVATGGSGGGAHLESVVDAVWTNDVLDGNTAVSGGGLWVQDSAAHVVNNHLLANGATTGGGLGAVDVDLVFSNDLVAWTSSGHGLHAEWTGERALDLGYCAWYPGTDGHLGGDLDDSDLDGTHLFEDPQLLDYTVGGACGTHQYPPVPDSPLVDAGDPALVDPNGSRSDIGAYGGQGSLWTDLDEDGVPGHWDCDDNDPLAGSPSSWVPDRDGDSFGDSEAEHRVACDEPAGWVTDATDCDDDDRTVYPGADEIPDDGVDQDCSGFDSEVTLGGSPACACDGVGSGGGWIVLATVVGWRRRRG